LAFGLSGFGGGGLGGIAAFPGIIGYVETGTLKYDAASTVDYPAYFHAALGAYL
jgi:hypothetical protein